MSPVALPSVRLQRGLEAACQRHTERIASLRAQIRFVVDGMEQLSKLAQA